MTLNDTDKFLVNRSGSSYHLEAQNLMAELLDDDLMLVNRAGKSYKATGAEIRDSLKSDVPPIIDTVILSKETDTESRFTNQEFAIKTTMAFNGEPPSNKVIDAYVEGNFKQYNGTLTTTVTNGAYEFGDPDDIFRGDTDARFGIFFGNPSGTGSSIDFDFSGFENGGIEVNTNIELLWAGNISEGGTPYQIWVNDALVLTDSAGDPKIFRHPMTGILSKLKILYLGSSTSGGFSVTSLTIDGEFIGESDDVTTKKYLRFESDGNVTDLLAAPQSPAYTTSDVDPALTLKFPATFPSGLTPDEEMAPGTSITAQVTASNSAGSDTKLSNIITPEGVDPIDLDEWGTVAVTAANWTSITYGNGYFVAVAASGTEKRIMYAEEASGPWTYVTPSRQIAWKDITFGDGYFVAVGYARYDDERVMYATDPAGPWQLVAPGNLSTYGAITYGDGKFVATLDDFSTSIMYAENPAGPWNYVSAPVKGAGSIAYGNGTFVAALNSTTDAVMYATDPAGTWQLATITTTDQFRAVAFGEGKFVLATSTGASVPIRYAEDPSGTWAEVPSAPDQDWRAIAHGWGKFVAVSGVQSSYMYAEDTQGPWTLIPTPVSGYWNDVVFGNGQFVAVSDSSGNLIYTKKGTTRYYDESNQRAIYDQEIVARFGIDPETTDLKPYGIAELTEQPDYPVAGYTPDGDKYRPIEDFSVQANKLTQVEAAVAALRIEIGLPAEPEVPQAIEGYYPLYVSETESNLVSTDGTSHTHTFDEVTYYMPNTGVTIYHGDYES